MGGSRPVMAETQTMLDRAWSSGAIVLGACIIAAAMIAYDIMKGMKK